MANTYQGFNPQAFARSAATTLAKHITDVEVACLRNFQIGALIEGNGRTSYNNGGEGFDWPVQYRMHQAEGNTGETQRNFARRNLWKIAQLQYRGYQVTDTMFYREFASNKGPEGIVKVYDGFVDRLTSSLKQALGPEYYVNGDATGRETSWHGLESIFKMAATAQSVKYDAGTARTANQEDIAGYPEGNYAGISLQLGNYNGENESGEIWPNGIADPEYDFWTPLVVVANTTHADLPSSTNTWAGQADEALRWGILNSQRNGGMDTQITNIILSRDFYLNFLNLIDSKETIETTNSPGGLRSLGFKNVVIFDGLEVSWEPAVPSETGYGLNWRNMELMSMDATLFRPEGPEYDLHSQSFNAVVSTLSNLKFKSPRNFVKWCNHDDLGKNDA